MKADKNKNSKEVVNTDDPKNKETNLEEGLSGITEKKDEEVNRELEKNRKWADEAWGSGLKGLKKSEGQESKHKGASGASSDSSQE